MEVRVNASFLRLQEVETQQACDRGHVPPKVFYLLGFPILSIVQHPSGTACIVHLARYRRFTSAETNLFPNAVIVIVVRYKTTVNLSKTLVELIGRVAQSV